MDEQEIITRLFRIRRTAMEMLQDRGFNVDDTEISMSRQDFINKFLPNTDSPIKREELTFIKSKINNESDRIYVFFPQEPKVGTAIIRNYLARMGAEGVHRGIFVVQHSLTPTAKKVMELSKNYKLEVFQDAELVVNIKRHEYVPEHRVLTAEGKKSLLARYAVKETQLPQIKITDPMAKYYGLQRGEVVMIIRNSELGMDDKDSTPCGKSVTYRFVV